MTVDPKSLVSNIIFTFHSTDSFRLSSSLNRSCFGTTNIGQTIGLIQLRMGRQKSSVRSEGFGRSYFKQLTALFHSSVKAEITGITRLL